MNKQKQHTILIILIVIIGVISIIIPSNNNGVMDVYANSLKNTDYASSSYHQLLNLPHENEVHYSEDICNVKSHYTDGIHYHDESICTNINHNHNNYVTTTKAVTTQKVQEIHYSETNCNVKSHYTNGVHYHNESTCTNSSHNHHNTNSHHGKGHH